MLPSEGGIGNNTKYEKGYLMAWWTEKAMIEKKWELLFQMMRERVMQYWWREHCKNIIKESKETVKTKGSREHTEQFW